VAQEVFTGKLIAFRQIAARLVAGKEPLMEPQDPMLGGMPVSAWIAVFWDTHTGNGMGGVMRVEWPDEGGYAAQANVTVEALDEVQSAVLKEAELERARSGNAT
jgi:hypothetical protein